MTDAGLLRLIAAINALAGAGITVVAVHVSLWHDYADAEAIQAAQQAVEMHRYGVPVTVHTASSARKPSPLLLRIAGASCYYGDSPEDELAAQNAGIGFVKVERFL